MSFRAVIASSGIRLSPSEDRAVNVMLGLGSADLTAAEVADYAATHESTVVRLAKKLGYRGYRELRADIRRDAAANATDETIMRSASGYDLTSFVADEIGGLDRIERFISQGDIEAVAKTIASSETIYLFSGEDERATVELMARRMRRLGLVVVEMRPAPKDLAERVSSMGARSTLIAFALREAPAALSPLIAETRRRGGASILIADVPGYAFRPAPDHLLASMRSDDDGYRTQIVPIALCYAVQLATYHLDEPRFRAVREGIDDLTRAFGGTNEIPLRS